MIAYFNYINRVAEGVGTDPEPEWGPRPDYPRPLRLDPADTTGDTHASR